MGGCLSPRGSQTLLVFGRTNKLLEPFGATDAASAWGSAVAAGLGGTAPEDFPGGELKLDGFFVSRDRSIFELSHALLVQLDPILPLKLLPGQCWCELQPPECPPEPALRGTCRQEQVRDGRQLLEPDQTALTSVRFS